jgi:hypothetical protein
MSEECAGWVALVSGARAGLWSQRTALEPAAIAPSGALAEGAGTEVRALLLRLEQLWPTLDPEDAVGVALVVRGLAARASSTPARARECGPSAPADEELALRVPAVALAAAAR